MSHIKNTEAQSATVSSTQAFDTLNVGYNDGLSLQLVLTNNSSADISFKLQISNDDSNWVDLPGSTIAITANGSHMIEIEKVYAQYIRAYFTRTGGQIDAALTWKIWDVPA